MESAAVAPPPQIPEWIHLVLWSALAAWLICLMRDRGRIGSGRLAMVLCLACFPAIAVMVAATALWPQPEADSFVRGLLWLAVALGLSGALMWLRHRSDGGPDDREPAEPEPPWWPKFEDDFRRYVERRRRPRQPVA